MVGSVAHRRRRPRRALAGAARADPAARRTDGSSATPTSATSPTTSCPRGSASWCAATRSARARASAAPRSSGRSSSSGSSIPSSSWRWRRSRSSSLGIGGVLATAVILGAAFVGLLVVGARRRVAEPSTAGRGPGHGHGRAVPAGPRAGAPAARRAVGGPAGRATLRRGAGLQRRRVGRLDRHVRAGGRGRSAIELTPLQGALLSSGVALATIVPSGPGLSRDVRADGGRHRDAVRRRTRIPAFAMALLVHAMILAVTSVGGVISAVRLGVGRSTRSSPGPDRRRSAPAARQAGRALGVEPRGRDAALGGGDDLGRRRVVRLEPQRFAGPTGHAQELEGVALVHLGDERDRLDVVRATRRGARLGPAGPQAERQAGAVGRCGTLEVVDEARRALGLEVGSIVVRRRGAPRRPRAAGWTGRRRGTTRRSRAASGGSDQSKASATGRVAYASLTGARAASASMARPSIGLPRTIVK